jgi:Tfp pilus assembly protein PilF
MRRLVKAVLLAGAAGGLFATAAIASGGGGGGGAPMPSMSAPSYDPAAEYAKGVAALKANQFRDASRAFDHVTQAAPRSPDGWRLLGVAKAGDNDWKGSRRAYERALKLGPDDVETHAGLGLALANLKDPKAQGELDWLNAKAQACGDTCPDSAKLKSLAGQVQAAMSGGTPGPAAMLENRSMLFAGGKAGDAAYVQAVSLINQHRYDEALASLQAAETVFGPHPDILTYQGYTWRKKGDYAKAEGFYRQALAISPDHRGATEYYGELKVERHDMAGAKVLLARLDRVCAYGCAEAEELRRWIDVGGDPKAQ